MDRIRNEQVYRKGGYRKGASEAVYYYLDLEIKSWLCHVFRLTEEAHNVVVSSNPILVKKQKQ